MEFITIAHFATATEAHLVRTRLEADGLDCMILDEQSASMLPLASAAGGVQVQVRPEDLERATAIIEELDGPVIEDEMDVEEGAWPQNQP